MDLNIPLPVIGIVHTSHAELEATPIQAGLNRAQHGAIEIADRYQEDLDGLAEFDYAWLHRLAEPGSDPPLRHVPFLLRSQQRSKGIFATGGLNGSTPSGSASSRSST
jgi:tRNA (Thr-GGU) A37 N-methylase